jgi:signal transduction histidine kinase
MPAPVPSLRRKIRAAYAALALTVLVLCGVALVDLLVLKNQVEEGATVYALEDAILETRRQEKNLLLYGDLDALSAADARAAAALDTLGAERRVLSAVANAGELGALEADLRVYRDLLGRHREQGDGDSGQGLDDQLRARGHALSTAADRLARRERQALAEAVSESQMLLGVTILIVVVLVATVGRRLVKAVVVPLRRLELSLTPIAEGRFDRVDPDSRDQEFVAFADALNRMLRELEARRRRLLQAEKLASLGVLVAGVAHELNNPLSNISSTCQILLEELPSAERAELEDWLRQIDGESDRARRIVQTLLDYGRQGPFKRRPVDLQVLVGKTLVLLHGSLEEAGARVQVDVPPGLTLWADAQRLQQVFINLVRNALQAGGEGTQVRLSARMHRVGEDEPPLPAGAEVLGTPGCSLPRGACFVQILVEDDGPGISPDHLPRVFDPFFTTREPRAGMGLGLYIVQEIVREHDGCIAAGPAPGRGTRFWLRLPCADQAGDGGADLEH